MFGQCHVAQARGICGLQFNADLACFPLAQLDLVYVCVFCRQRVRSIGLWDFWDILDSPECRFRFVLLIRESAEYTDLSDLDCLSKSWSVETVSLVKQLGISVIEREHENELVGVQRIICTNEDVYGIVKHGLRKLEPCGGERATSPGEKACGRE